MHSNKLIVEVGSKVLLTYSIGLIKCFVVLDLFLSLDILLESVCCRDGDYGSTVVDMIVMKTGSDSVYRP
jgi:hypothetical protein